MYSTGKRRSRRESCAARSAGLRGPAVLGPRQSQVLPQGRAFVLRAEQAAALQLRNEQVDDIVEPLREGQRQHVETVGGAGCEPMLQRVGDLRGRASHRAVRALDGSALGK